MFHGSPSAEQGPDPAARYKARLGIFMFLIYLIIYSGFVAINVISPKLMAKTVFLGLNLAVTYGIGLIVFALIQALIYSALCGAMENRFKSAESTEGRA